MQHKMQEKEETPPPMRVHFQKLHERIQNKYHEMQKRLEKSKSIDTLSNVSDDMSYKESRYSSSYELREFDEVFTNDNDIKHAVSVENVQKQKAVVIESSIVSYAEPICGSIKDNGILDDDWEQIEYGLAENSLSLESLNEVGKESDDSSRPSPTVKRFRDRIGTKLMEVRERRERKRIEKERRLTEKRKESNEIAERIILSNSSKNINVRLNKKQKLATVTIALIEATGLDIIDERPRLLSCRFRLGLEKYKSKSSKPNGSTVQWQELFNLFMYEENISMEVNMHDKDSSVCRTFIDLSELEKDKTHRMKINLNGDMPNVQLFVLLTISGIPLHNTVTEVDDVYNAQKQIKVEKRAWYHLENNLHDVGWLTVIVYGAKGLVTHDCYCVLKLTNERRQTHTEYKTNDPNWMKIFHFKLTDITSILEISVFDEKKVEETGKISIPLLKINNGVKTWYALKDQNQRERAKGNNPRILLEMRTSWNLAKAAVRVINPKEVDLLGGDGKFDRRVFARNIARARTVTLWTLDSLKLIKTCFEWESKKSNLIALVSWILFCYFFKIWMLPLLLLIPFVKYRPDDYYLINWSFFQKQKAVTEDLKIEKEEKSSLRQKINSLQEMVQTVQNGIEKLASLGERAKNLCNFTVPFVSLFAVLLILVMSFVMYIIPLQYILICWGIHKFTRKIIRPNRVPNSEILDLLSRVPDDETLLNCEQLSLENSIEDNVD